MTRPPRRALAAVAAGWLCAGAAPAVADTTVADGARDQLVINVVGDIAYPNGWGGITHIDDKKHELFALVQPILDSGDLNFANLESPLTDVVATAEKKYPIACKSQRLEYITGAGFNLFSLANNHSTDAGAQGITDTLALLRQRTSAQRPLQWAGTGETASAARAPARFRAPGKRAVVSFIAVANTGGQGKVAGLHDPRLLARISQEAKASDIVIVSVHYGPEYEHVPWKSTVDLYHEWIDAGAQLVVGHHAHVVQGFERYKHGFIFYNLGNFSFGSRTRRHLKTAARMYSAIGRVTFTGNQITQVELVPLYANNSARWTLGERTLLPRHAEPQLLAGEFAQFALDEFDDFTARVPGNEDTRLVRIGDRAYADLGRAFTDEEKAALVARQAREYQAVVRAGAEPRPATPGEMNQKTRAGTPLRAEPPDPPPDEPGKKKKGAKNKRPKPSAKSARKKAGKPKPSRKPRR